LKELAYEQLADQHAQLQAAYCCLEVKYNSLQTAHSVSSHVSLPSLTDAAEQSAESIQETSSICTPLTETITGSFFPVLPPSLPETEPLSHKPTDNLAQLDCPTSELEAHTYSLPSSPPSLFKSPSLSSSTPETEDSNGLISPLTFNRLNYNVESSSSVQSMLLQGNICDSAVIVSSPQPMVPCNACLPTLEFSRLLHLILASVIYLSVLSQSSLRTLWCFPLTRLVLSPERSLDHSSQKPAIGSNSLIIPCDPG